MWCNAERWQYTRIHVWSVVVYRTVPVPFSSVCPISLIPVRCKRNIWKNFDCSALMVTWSASCARTIQKCAAAPPAGLSSGQSVSPHRCNRRRSLVRVKSFSRRQRFPSGSGSSMAKNYPQEKKTVNKFLVIKSWMLTIWRARGCSSSFKVLCRGLTKNVSQLFDDKVDF